MAREPNYDILSEWMAYYSRYAIGNNDVMLGFSLVQLVTSELGDIAIPAAQPTLPCSAVFRHI
jgi:hypothetical protein